MKAKLKSFFSDEFVQIMIGAFLFLFVFLPFGLHMDAKHREETGYRTPQQACEDAKGIYMSGGFGVPNCVFPPKPTGDPS